MLPLFCALSTLFFPKRLRLSQQGTSSPLRLGFETRSHGLPDAFFEPSNRSPREFSGHKRQCASPRRPVETRGLEGCGILYSSLHKAWDSPEFAFSELALSRAQIPVMISNLLRSVCTGISTRLKTQLSRFTFVNQLLNLNKVFALSTLLFAFLANSIK
jgi:hypothetical protein